MEDQEGFKVLVVAVFHSFDDFLEEILLTVMFLAFQLIVLLMHTFLQVISQLLNTIFVKQSYNCFVWNIFKAGL